MTTTPAEWFVKEITGADDVFGQPTMMVPKNMPKEDREWLESQGWIVKEQP